MQRHAGLKAERRIAIHKHPVFVLSFTARGIAANDSAGIIAHRVAVGIIGIGKGDRPYVSGSGEHALNRNHGQCRDHGEQHGCRLSKHFLQFHWFPPVFLQYPDRAKAPGNFPRACFSLLVMLITSRNRGPPHRRTGPGSHKTGWLPSQYPASGWPGTSSIPHRR